MMASSSRVALRYAPPKEAHWESFYRVLFSLILVLLASLLAAALVYAAIPIEPKTYIEDQGIPAGIPLAALATFMTITWLPMFMPALVPIVMAIFAAWFIAVAVAVGAKRLVTSLSHRAATRTVDWVEHSHHDWFRVFRASAS